MRIEKRYEIGVLLFILIIFILLVSIKLSNSHITTGLSTMSGQLGFGIASSEHYLTNNFQVANETTLNTGLNTTLILRANATGEAGFVNLTLSSSNPTSNSFVNKTALDKFATLETNINFTNATLSFNYSDGELGQLNESTLRIYHYNQSGDSWTLLPGGVDQSANFVYGLTTSFSPFGVFGDLKSDSGTNPGSSSSGSSGGGASGGGGGGGSAKLKKPGDFEIVPPIMAITLSKGKRVYGAAKITNTGGNDLVLALDFENLNEFDIDTEKILTLKAGETKEIKLGFSAKEGTPEDIYLGKILVKSEKRAEEINVIVNFRQQESLFDLKVRILPDYQNVKRGARVIAGLEMQNIGTRGRLIDVNLNTYITDFDRRVVLQSSKETVAVGAELALTREFKVPSDMKDGKYLFVAEMDYGNVTVKSYDLFEVEGELQGEKTEILSSNFQGELIISLLILVVGVIIGLFYLKLRGLDLKLSGLNTRKVEKRLVSELEVLEQLERLDQAYKEGVISTEHYSAAQNKLIKKLKMIKLSKDGKKSI